MKISIIIPVYNRENLIEESLESVKNQITNDWECLLIDDNSTDDSVLVIQNFILENDLSDKIKVFSNLGKKGAQGARNTGIIKSTGDLIMFLDSDDLLLEHCIQRRLEIVRQNPNFDYYCFSTVAFYDVEQNNCVFWNRLHGKENDLCRFLSLDPSWHTMGILWRKSIFNEGFPKWDENVSSFQDWEIHVRLLLELKYTYFKAPNDYIDNLYRKTDDHEAISKDYASPKAIENKIYLTRKVLKIVSNKGVLIKYREYCEIFVRYFAGSTAIGNVEQAIQIIYIAKKYGIFSNYQAWFLKFYYTIRFNYKIPKILRGGMELIYRKLKKKVPLESEFMKIKVNMKNGK